MRLLPLALTLLSLSGCRSDDKAASDDTGPAGSGGEDSGGEEALTADPSGAIVLSDPHNYAYNGALDAPSTTVAELSDITLDFSELVDDLQCHELDPVADIDQAVLLVFPYLTQEEVEEGLSTDSLEQVDLGVYLSQETGESTSVQLADFTFFGTDADIETEFTEGSGTWLVTFATGDSVGVGNRMLAFIEPSASSDVTEVSVTDGCSLLDYTVDITSAEVVPVLADGPWALDWSAITTTGQGTEFVATKVSSLMLAHYADLDVAGVEDNFLDLELIPTDMWTLDHASGTSADLSAATHVDDGSAFPGFSDGDGTWVLALRCVTCPNPAPLVLSVLVPSPPAG